MPEWFRLHADDGVYEDGVFHPVAGSSFQKRVVSYYHDMNLLELVGLFFFLSLFFVNCLGAVCMIFPVEFFFYGEENPPTFAFLYVNSLFYDSYTAPMEATNPVTVFIASFIQGSGLLFYVFITSLITKRLLKPLSVILLPREILVDSREKITTVRLRISNAIPELLLRTKIDIVFNYYKDLSTPPNTMVELSVSKTFDGLVSLPTEIEFLVPTEHQVGRDHLWMVQVAVTAIDSVTGYICLAEKTYYGESIVFEDVYPSMVWAKKHAINDQIPLELESSQYRLQSPSLDNYDEDTNRYHLDFDKFCFRPLHRPDSPLFFGLDNPTLAVFPC
eukprot:Lithocolla_globosa_v1_NODE_164_length_5560_cov_17.853588.p3 type:complete len:332 gc:universal NODE_164_length_5560_cov_17.853588:3476-4471(+)